MALGIKSQVGRQKGDIIQAEAGISIFQKSGDEAVQYDTAIIGDRIGFATGQTVKIGGSNYVEFVLINRVLESQEPDFSTPKFYVLEGMPVSYKANPDYNYPVAEVAKPKNFWSTVGNIFNTVFGIFGVIRNGNTGTNTGTGPNNGISNQNDNTPAPTEQTWLQKNAILVVSTIVIIATSTIIYAVSKKKDK